MKTSLTPGPSRTAHRLLRICIAEKGKQSRNQIGALAIKPPPNWQLDILSSSNGIYISMLVVTPCADLKRSHYISGKLAQSAK